MRYPCFACGKSVTSELPKDSIIRAELICPECVEAGFDYEGGFADGLTCFAWMKDGVQYVGTCGTTLKEALKKLAADSLWNKKQFWLTERKKYD